MTIEHQSTSQQNFEMLKPSFAKKSSSALALEKVGGKPELLGTVPQVLGWARMYPYYVQRKVYQQTLDGFLWVSLTICQVSK